MLNGPGQTLNRNAALAILTRTEAVSVTSDQPIYRWLALVSAGRRRSCCGLTADRVLTFEPKVDWGQNARPQV